MLFAYYIYNDKDANTLGYHSELSSFRWMISISTSFTHIFNVVILAYIGKAGGWRKLRDGYKLILLAVLLDIYVSFQ